MLPAPEPRAARLGADFRRIALTQHVYACNIGPKMTQMEFTSTALLLRDAPPGRQAARAATALYEAVMGDGGADATALKQAAYLAARKLASK